MKLLFLFVFASSLFAAPKVKVKVDGVLDPCAFEQHGDIFCGITGTMSQLRSGDIVIPMLKTILVLDIDGKYRGHTNGGSRFSGKAFELPDGSLLFGNYDDLVYKLNPDGSLISKMQISLGSIGSSFLKLKNGNIVFGSTDHPGGGYPMAVGHINIMDSNLRPIIRYVVNGTYFKSTPVQLNNGNVVIRDSYGLAFFNEKKYFHYVRLSENGKGLYRDPILTSEGEVLMPVHGKMVFYSQEGKKLREFRLNETAHDTSPALELENGNFVASTIDGFAYFFNRDGEILAKHKVGEGDSTTEFFLLKNGLVATTHSREHALYLFTQSGELVKVFKDGIPFKKKNLFEMKDGRLLVPASVGDFYSGLVILSIELE